MRNRNHPQYLGEPIGRASSRRAALYRNRARELGESAARETFADRRKFMLDLAATYTRVANAMAPPPPATSEAQSIFRPPHAR